MADPITWQILTTIGNKLADITPANGYHTDAGSRIQYEHEEFGADDTYPQIVVTLEEPAIDEAKSNGYRSTLTIVAEAYIHITLADAQLKAHQVMEDITRAWARLKRSDLSGIEIRQFELAGERRILQRPEGLDFIVVQVRSEVTYDDFPDIQ